MTKNKNKKRVYDGPPASAAFKGAVEGGGDTAVTCSWCEREHIAIDSSNNGESEDCDPAKDYIFAYDMMKPDVIKMALSDPDTYILVEDVDFIHYAEIDGTVIPDDCPCNGLGRFETFIWGEIGMIKRYLAIKKLSLAADMNKCDL